jgi:hypothetical protein
MGPGTQDVDRAVADTPGERLAGVTSPHSASARLDQAKPPARAATAAALRSRLMAWARALDADEPLIIFSLLSLCVLIKVLWLTPVDIYWDAGAKWHFARQWSYANDFSHAHWSHHMARFGVNVPAYFAQLLFGTAPRIYYVVPIASFAVQVLFVYLLARRLGGRAAGLLGALFMIFTPGMNRGATQLLPDGIVATAAVIGAYAVVRFHEASAKPRRRWLIGVGLACVLAYAIKESSVLLFPGFMLAVWLSRRSFKEAFIFGGVLATYGLLETAGFRLFTPYAHRLAIVQEEHGYYPPMQFWELFQRFSKLDPPSQLLFWMWVASSIYLLGSSDRRRRLLVPLSLVFVLVLTFMVRRINPIIPWLSFKPRYMSPAGGLFVVSVSLLLSDALRRLWARWRRPSMADFFRDLSNESGYWTLALCVTLGAGVYLRERRSLDHHPLTQLRRDASILNDAFRRNLPIIEEASNPRGLNTVYAVYLRPKYLAKSDVAHDGRLPNIQEGVRFSNYGKKYGHILRDKRAYKRGDLKRLIRAGCFVEVTARHQVALSTRHKLPDTCKAPRGAPLPP